jgi:hypothetical protein
LGRFIVGTFWGWDVLWLGCFGAWDILRLWTFWSWDVLGLARFGAWDVLGLGCFIGGTLCIGMFYNWDVPRLGVEKGRVIIPV